MNNEKPSNAGSEVTNVEATATAKKGSKCYINTCLDRAAKIIGACRYCEHAYCGKHRLPECHGCEGLNTCRQESYDKNSDKLLNGKCVADKL